MNEHIEKHGFIILNNYFDTTIKKKLRFYEKKLEDREYKKLLDEWSGINGNNPYVRNINRKSYELYATYYYDLLCNNRLTQKEKDTILKSHYMYDNDNNSMNELNEEFEIKYKKLINWTYNYTHYIFKDLFEEILNSYNNYNKVMLISVKIHILYPNCKEQEIHCDKYEDPMGKFENGITTQGKLLIITIALNDINKDLNTIFYDRELLNGFNIQIKELKENLMINDYELFKKARFQTKANIGDMQIHDGKCYHHGPENKSNNTRRFLFIEIQLFN
tara:strand:- start:510 stop:1337 length:828 start_codon:yes stop_codon:yes gene_type:complete